MNNNTILASLRIEGNKVMVSSIDVAAVFEKEHKNVMASIRELIEQKPEIGRLNFQQSSYINSQNKQQPCYLMDRDGFTLLAMGFTGTKALDFKLMYIQSFNEMEKELREREKSEAKPVAAKSKIESIIEGGKLLSDWLGVPKHIAAKETVKEVKRLTGVDYSMLLTASPIMDNIKKEEQMLEPKELGNIFKQELFNKGFTHGNTGANVNSFLSFKGFQMKHGNVWEPTCVVTEGKHYVRHAWDKGSKSGYNYKWNKSFFESLLK